MCHVGGEHARDQHLSPRLHPRPLMMLSLLFSVQVLIPDNRVDVGVGTNAGFVSRCLHSLHIEPQAAAREERCTTSRKKQSSQPGRG